MEHNTKLLTLDVNYLSKEDFLTIEKFFGDSIVKLREFEATLPLLPEDIEYRVESYWEYNSERDVWEITYRYVPTWKVGTIHNPAPPQD
jgi:hypothetical protein